MKRGFPDYAAHGTASPSERPGSAAAGVLVVSADLGLPWSCSVLVRSRRLARGRVMVAGSRPALACRRADGRCDGSRRVAVPRAVIPLPPAVITRQLDLALECLRNGGDHGKARGRHSL